MVETLFGTPGAANDDLIYKMASDVYADQTTEIRVMENMPQKTDPPGRGNPGGSR